jgi:CheY-like chemotaxis protein
MSHEIRTPMNGILGFAELLKEPELTGEQQQNYIGIIEKSGARMLNIINDIIDISKIEAGLMKVEMQESNVIEQIEYIYTFFKPEVENKGMQLIINNKLSAKEAIVYTDREKLYAILTNLVKNAIKYSNTGYIEIGCEKIKTSQNQENEQEHTLLRFFVKDTGIGIPTDRQQAIFERFIQADIEDEMARQGAGLGLAITKSYLAMMGGEIWVESEVGIGSCFYFTLPCIAKMEEKIHNINARTDIQNYAYNLKILIAEDDETSEMLLSIIAGSYSREIIKVKNGNEAIEACHSNPDIDLILMDIQMPKMGGYEAARQIRKFNKQVVIIAQTAFGLFGDKEKAIQAGCNDYLAKPINKAEFIKLIYKYFDNTCSLNQ